jgi:hypothetical protein
MNVDSTEYAMRTMPTTSFPRRTQVHRYKVWSEAQRAERRPKEVDRGPFLGECLAEAFVKER